MNEIASRGLILNQAVRSLFFSRNRRPMQVNRDAGQLEQPKRTGE